MKLTVNSQALATELRLINKIVPTKPAIAILSHALLRVDDKLNLYATDLEVGLSTDCVARVQVPGTTVLPVAKFLAIVEQFPDADVELTLDKHQVIVRCGAFTSRLSVPSTKDFPEPPVVEGTSSVLDAAALGVLMARTRYAVTANGSKFVLKGALLTLSGSVAAMVATDSKRLAIATMSRTGVDQRVIVPAKTLDVLAGHVGSGDVEVTVGPRHLFFSVGGRLLTSRTIDGVYPKYERIIPRDNDKSILIDRSLLASALRRVVLAADANGAVLFSVTPGNVELSSSSAEVGSANEAVRVEYDGPPLKVIANGGYVLDFLAAASGQIVTMALKDANSPALLTDGDSHVAVIMLMRK